MLKEYQDTLDKQTREQNTKFEAINGKFDQQGVKFDEMKVQFASLAANQKAMQDQMDQVLSHLRPKRRTRK